MLKLPVKVAAILLFLLAGLFVGTSQASADTVSSSVTPAASAPGEPVTTFLYDHECRVLGTDSYGNQGVACADLYYGVGQDSGNPYLVGENEIFCQNSSGTIVECAGIHETAALCDVNDGCFSNSGVCGERFGHSACGVRRVENLEWVEYVPCWPNAWGDALNTSIVLPQSGLTVGGTGANEATNHIDSNC